jgi:transcription termination factor NusA
VITESFIKEDTILYTTMATLTDIKGVSDSRADNLRDEGFSTVDDIAEAEVDALAEVHGLGESSAYDLIENAQETLRSDHIDDEEEEDEEPDLDELDEVEVEDEEEDEPEEEEVTEEDVQELVEEAAEDEEEPDLEEEEDEDEEEEEELEEPFEISFEVPSDTHYDYLHMALLDAQLDPRSADEEAALCKALDAVRPLGGEGEASFECTRVELNHIHAALRNAETGHQSNRQSEAFEALRDIRRAVDRVRSAKIF